VILCVTDGQTEMLCTYVGSGNLSEESRTQKQSVRPLSEKTRIINLE